MNSLVMPSIPRTGVARPQGQTRWRKLGARFWRHRWLYLLLLPGLVYYLVFVYLPYAGTILVFQDYSPFLGYAGSKWVGLKHFVRLFTDPIVRQVVVNTLMLSGLQIAIAFPVPIALALMLNEVRNQFFKRTIQTAIYFPHFISWVIIVSIWYQLFNSRGLVNQILAEVNQPTMSFLTNPAFFRPTFIIQGIWRDAGWGTVIFLAALSGIDVALYEAAAVDGASRWQRMVHITIPSLLPVVMIVLILRLGTVLTVGFEHVFLLLNSSNDAIAQVIETYVYYRGVISGNFSFAATVDLAKGAVGLVLVLAVNRLAKLIGQGGIF
jgi:putative aldouronate transport system permease protein